MPPDVQSTELTPVIDKAKCSAAMDVLKHAEKEIHPPSPRVCPIRVRVRAPWMSSLTLSP